MSGPVSHTKAVVVAVLCFLLSGVVAGHQPIQQPNAQQPSEDEQPRRIRISQGVAEGMLVNRVPPPYPPLARAARIQGSVVLALRIGRDGAVEWLSAVQGHPMLIPAAIEAVKQWQYKPFYLNGEPVPVATTVTVNFTLANGPNANATAAPDQLPSATPRHVGLPENLAELLVTSESTPVYPELARHARIAGYVMVRVVLNEEGQVQEIQSVQGHPMLAPAAMESLKQWQFRPLKSVPVVVESVKWQGGELREGEKLQAGFLATFHFDGNTAKVLSPIPITPATDQVPKVHAGLLINRVQPKYPQELEPSAGPARVMVEINVGPDGAVTKVTPQDGDARFFAAAIAAVQQWRYVPGFVRGEPIPTVHHALVQFTPPQRSQIDVP